MRLGLLVLFFDDAAKARENIKEERDAELLYTWQAASGIIPSPSRIAARGSP